MKTILIVDDQLLYIKTLEIALKNQFKVLLAQSYDESISLLSQQEIDIILADIRLDNDNPENADGLRIIEWVAINKPRIAAFAMSAYTEFSYDQEARRLGARHFFRKPIDMLTLIDILQEKG